MFCYQCEETTKGEGCVKGGICGKSSEVASLQDVLIYALKGLALYAIEARKVGIIDEEVDQFTCEAIFSTITNVSFDTERFIKYINRCVELRDSLRKRVEQAGGKTAFTEDPVNFTPDATKDGLLVQAEKASVELRPGADPDIHSLRGLLTYGIKGVAAYAYHAAVLGKRDEEIFRFIYEGLAATLHRAPSVDGLLGLVLKCGEVNLRVMKLLDEANTGSYGHPVPTKVPLGAKKGHAILVSGHDLKDLEEILKQSQGKGIYVYTHGEMLPAHGYPKLKEYAHFYGHYGTAWQNQAKEFAEFPGAILMTTNCLKPPKESYKDNIFTIGPVGYPGLKHIKGRDFAPAIERALDIPGFPQDTEGRFVTVGFGHNAVMRVADKIIEAVKNGHIRHFFLVGGCDGAKPGRNYYTEFVEKVPEDCIVLTLACGKFRFFDKQLGEIGGIPRLLDIGQCNDAYSAIQIASALADAFKCGVNDLPLSMVLSWYEQKAVSILLTLLYLGVKDIRLGPSLPAFVSPNVLKVLQDKFNLQPITTPDEDLNTILANK